MTQYMLSVHHVEGEPEMTMEEIQPIFEAVEAFNQKARDAGIWVFAGGLMPRETAVRVDATGGEAVVTDGPFAESKEFLAGYRMVDVESEERAIEIAAQSSEGPGYNGVPLRQQIEVRQVMGAPEP